MKTTDASAAHSETRLPRIRSRRLWLLSPILIGTLVLAACSESEPEIAPPTSNAGPVTTAPDGDAGTADPVDLAAEETAEVESEPEPEIPLRYLDFEEFYASVGKLDLEALVGGIEDAGPLGGAHNMAATAAVIDLLMQAGVDTSGYVLYVFPVTGTDTSLLVMEVTDDFGSDEGQASDVGISLFDLPEVAEANITHMVVITRQVSDEGSYLVTTMVSIDAMRRVEETGEELVMGEDWFFQIKEIP